MIVLEAVVLTSVAGYVGLVAATGLIEILSRYLPENDYFRNPEVDFRAALISTLVLVIVGALAGLMPALRAARVKPVVAMREA
jgi:putative ABC transport system permease protein